MKGKLFAGILIAVLTFITACANPFFPERKVINIVPDFEIDLPGFDLEAGINIETITAGEETQPLEITINNTGKNPTGDLTITTSSDNWFTIEPAGRIMESIPPGEGDSFTITPNENLPPGEYSVTVTITGGNGIEIEFEVRFVVEEAELPYDPSKTYPVITTLPTAATVTYGDSLYTSTLTGGIANVPGTFAWRYGTIIPKVNNSGFSVVFTPENTETYNSIAQNVSITVNPKAITITGVTATDRAYTGEIYVELNGGDLQGVVAGDTVGFTLGKGEMADANAGIGKAVATNIQLTGADADNYTLGQPAVTVTINRAPSPGNNSTSLMFIAGSTLLTQDVDLDSLLPVVIGSYGTMIYTAAITDEDGILETPDAGTVTSPMTVTVKDTKADGQGAVITVTAASENYEPFTIVVNVGVTAKVPATVIVTPPVTGLVYGELLGNPGAEAGVTGTFTFRYTGTLADGKNSVFGPVYVKPTLPGSYTVTATLVSDTHAGMGTADFAITPRILTWAANGVADNRTYNGGTGATQFTAPTLSGVINEDDVTVYTGTLTFAGATAGTHTVTAVGYSITGVDAWKYVAPSTQPSFGTAVIGKAPAPNITFPTIATPITYGQPLSASTLNILYNNFGTFGWTIPSTIPTVAQSGGIGFSVTFTPNAYTIANYETITMLTANVPVTVNRAIGSAVTQPAVSGIPTHNSITVGIVTLTTATGQEIEYAIAQVNNAPPSTWQSSTTFIGLTPNATYYVYARSKESANYNTGAFNVSAGIRTAAQGTFPIDFAALVNLAPEIEGPTIFRAGGVDRTTATLVVDNSGQYDRVTWLYRGQPINGEVVDSDRGVTLTQNGADLTLSANPTGGFSLNFVTLEVRIGTMTYSKLISFTIRP
jgi:hypothetical protein